MVSDNMVHECGAWISVHKTTLIYYTEPSTVEPAMSSHPCDTGEVAFQRRFFCDDTPPPPRQTIFSMAV